jgi:hypothetical protein
MIFVKGIDTHTKKSENMRLREGISRQFKLPITKSVQSTYGYVRYRKDDKSN